MLGIYESLVELLCGSGASDNIPVYAVVGQGIGGDEKLGHERGT
jgi:hypothetical protein